MKRLFIVASLAIAAIGCQKTEVQNEVLTPIGFNTEIGKQTRSINNGSTVQEEYGVYSYLYNNKVQVPDPVMNNQKVTINGATEGATYYWPNDPDNHINFYAYSPYSVSAEMGTEGKLELAEYTHNNYYGENDAVDFMVATAVKEATFAGTYGTGEPLPTYGAGVPIVFHHEMTQVQFAVTADVTSDVTVDLVSIKFNNAVKTATYTNTLAENFAVGNWAPATDYVKEQVEAFPLGLTVTNPKAEGFKLYPMTMIPITPASITVKYNITANNTTEVVEETMTLPTDQWAANKKITYKLSIGLHPISFKAEVASWGTNTDVPFVPTTPAN